MVLLSYYFKGSFTDSVSLDFDSITYIYSESIPFFDFRNVAILLTIRRWFDITMFLVRLSGFVSQFFLINKFWSVPFVIVLINDVVFDDSFICVSFVFFGLLVIGLVLFLDFKHLIFKSPRNIFYKLLTIFVTANGILALLLLFYQFYFPNLVSPTFLTLRLVVIANAPNFYSNLQYFDDLVKHLSSQHLDQDNILGLYDLAVLNQAQIYQKLTISDSTWFSWFLHLSPASITGTCTWVAVFLTLFVHFFLLPWARKKNESVSLPFLAGIACKPSSLFSSNRPQTGLAGFNKRLGPPINAHLTDYKLRAQKAGNWEVRWALDYLERHRFYYFSKNREQYFTEHQNQSIVDGQDELTFTPEELDWMKETFTPEELNWMKGNEAAAVTHTSDTRDEPSPEPEVEFGPHFDPQLDLEGNPLTLATIDRVRNHPNQTEFGFTVVDGEIYDGPAFNKLLIQKDFNPEIERSKIIPKDLNTLEFGSVNYCLELVRQGRLAFCKESRVPWRFERTTLVPHLMIEGPDSGVRLKDHELIEYVNELCLSALRDFPTSSARLDDDGRVQVSRFSLEPAPYYGAPVNHRSQYKKIFHDYCDYTDIVGRSNDGRIATYHEVTRDIIYSQKADPQYRTRAFIKPYSKHYEVDVTYLGRPKFTVEQHQDFKEVMRYISSAFPEDTFEGDASLINDHHKFYTHVRTTINEVMLQSLYHLQNPSLELSAEKQELAKMLLVEQFQHAAHYHLMYRDPKVISPTIFCQVQHCIDSMF